MSRILVIIPTFNERENISQLLEKVFCQHSEISVLVVDDNSPDKTWEVVETLAGQKFPEKLHILKRVGKLGLGTAYIEGFKWAIERKFDLIFEMDADFSHNPEYVRDFLKASETADLVLGSRYVPGGGVRNWGPLRKLVSLGGSLYSRILLRLPYKDLTGGFKCFRCETLERIGLDEIQSNGYSFQIEMTYRAHLGGFKIAEVPIIFEDRTVGKSKMSSKIFLEAIFTVVMLRMKRKEIRGFKSV